MSSSDFERYYFATSCAMSVLVGHAARFGRGWYHLSDGELIVGVEIVL